MAVGEKVMRRLPLGRKRVMYFDNCSGHYPTTALDAAESGMDTELRFMRSSTYLVQLQQSTVDAIKNVLTQ